MIKSYVTLFTFLLAFSLSNSYAETYTWTDEQGTVHFTEDLGNVPKKIRKKARRIEDIEPPEQEKPASPAPSAKDPDTTLKATPSDKDGKTATAEIYAGKTPHQWEKDFKDREAAMTAVRKRIVEITELYGSPKTSRDEKAKLLAEDASLRAQFKEMKAQYDQQVEIAQKAGLKINSQK